MSAPVPPNVLLQLVADEFGVDVSDILSRGRPEPLATARLVAMVLCRQVWRLSTRQVGYLWGRNHADVIHAEKRVADLRDTDPVLRSQWDRLETACHAARRRRSERLRCDLANLDSNQAAFLREVVALFSDDKRQPEMSSLLNGSHSIGWTGNRITLHPITS